MAIRTAHNRSQTRKELRLLHRRCPRFRTLVGNPNTPKGMNKNGM